MKRRAQTVHSSCGQESYGAWLSFAVFFWLLTGVFLVVRDPLWRLLYEGQIVGGVAKTATPSVELDEKLLSQLERADVSPRTGNDALENEIFVAISDRIQKEAPAGAAAPTPLQHSETLRSVARARAQGRTRSGPSGESQPLELKFPDLYLAMIRPDRLTRAVEVHQELAGMPLADSNVPAELVGGWMNNMSFAGMIQQPVQLETGVGAVNVAHGGGISLDVLMVQNFVQLDRPLPSKLKRDSPLTLTGRRLTPEEVTLYFKGPRDASFAPLPVQWTGDQFSCTLSWSQGRGTYTLRARRGDRLSDPRRLLVK